MMSPTRLDWEKTRSEILPRSREHPPLKMAFSAVCTARMILGASRVRLEGKRTFALKDAEADAQGKEMEDRAFVR
jgi:hypothetical protein